MTLNYISYINWASGGQGYIVRPPKIGWVGYSAAKRVLTTHGIPICPNNHAFYLDMALLLHTYLLSASVSIVILLETFACQPKDDSYSVLRLNF